MNDETDSSEEPKPPEGSKSAKIARGALQAVGGAVPFVGGVLSAIAGAWSEGEQEKVNRFFEHWVRMLHDELCQRPSELTHWRTLKLTHLRMRIIVSLRAFLSVDSFPLRA